MVIRFYKKMHEIINLKNVSLILEKKQIYNLNLRITNGDFFLINGKNATGKSTLLKLFCLKILPTRGNFYLNGKNIGLKDKKLILEYRKKIGVILQNDYLIPFFSVYENIELASEIQNYKSDFNLRINQILDWLDLKEIENTKVDKLSKGEKQKVVIARALINKPNIIIADQPENFLDKSTVKKVFFLFESLNKQGTTIIITSNLEKIITVNYKTINLRPIREMINYKNVLKNILLKEEENFFHGLSFIITSLIAVHIVIYFNFYKFSSNWIELESKKTTFIVTNNFDEKEIPLSVKENIVDYLFKNDRLENFKILEPNIIKESLGLSEVRNLSGLNLPLIFQVISDKDRVIDEVYNNLLNISENRLVEKHEHEDQLYEIGMIVSRIKSIIFIMLLFVLILFSFLIMNIVKAALIANLNFVSMLQVMGASSLDLAKNISLSIFKKILPGTLLSLIFIFLISIILIRILGSNFNFFDSTYFSQLLVSNFFLLLVFMIIFTLTFLFFLTTYLFNFFENRFFEKF